MSTSSMKTEPSLGLSRPPIMLNRVDFPEPDGPIREIYSPRRMSRLTAFKARRVWPPIVYSLARFFVRTIYSCAVATAISFLSRGQGPEVRGPDRLPLTPAVRFLHAAPRQ